MFDDNRRLGTRSGNVNVSRGLSATDLDTVAAHLNSQQCQKYIDCGLNMHKQAYCRTRNIQLLLCTTFIIESHKLSAGQCLIDKTAVVVVRVSF